MRSDDKAPGASARSRALPVPAVVRTRIQRSAAARRAEPTWRLAVGAGARWRSGVILAERLEPAASAWSGCRDHRGDACRCSSRSVAVFVDPHASLVDEALKLGAIPQFHGDEPAEACEAFAAGPYLKAFHVSGDPAPTAERFARSRGPSSTRPGCSTRPAPAGEAAAPAALSTGRSPAAGRRAASWPAVG